MDIEPAKGAWQFQRLDRAVALAQQNGVDLLYTFGFTPRWASARPNEPCAWGNSTFGCSAEPRDLADWENYVRTVVRRYKGRIRHYEIWNEPAFTEIEETIQKNGIAKFFSGSAIRLAEMGKIAYRVVKEEDPRATVVSPSAVTGELGIRRLEAYLAAGGAKTFDVVGFHFYTTPPEELISIHRSLRTMLKKCGHANTPIWNTEMGYVFERPALGIKPVDTVKSIEDILPARLGAAYVARALLLSAAVGMKRVYWFDWETEKPPLLPMGLADEDGQKSNAAGVAYAQILRWLVGTTALSCESQKEVWSCTLQRDNRQAWIVWQQDSKSAVELHNRWNATAMETLSGSASRLESGTAIEVDYSPILLKREPLVWAGDALQ
ncbi:MAG: endo-1,4-beta-xylanase [Accumulibacter sp.]